MIYEDNFYQGYPALTVHRYGKGLAYYVCADAEECFYEDLYRGIITQQHIQPIIDAVPEGIEVSSRNSENYDYVFLQNFTNDPIPIRLPENAEILSGNYDGDVHGYSTVIFRRKTARF